MAHLQESLQRMADNDPSIIKIRKIPVGTMVRYRGRSGSMRQGRTQFPAVVLQQHADDGSLDLIVMYEAEDYIWEQRVQPFTDTNPDRSWELVEPVELDGGTKLDEIAKLLSALKQQMYGEYNAPAKSMIEYLDDFDKRLSKLESKYRSG